MGAKYLARNVDALATEGRLVVIGMQGGTKGELDLGALMRKRGAVIATALRARPVEEKAAICAAVVEHVWPLVGRRAGAADRARRRARSTRRRRAHELMECGEPHRQDPAHRLTSVGSRRMSDQPEHAAGRDEHVVVDRPRRPARRAVPASALAAAAGEDGDDDDGDERSPTWSSSRPR